MIKLGTAVLVASFAAGMAVTSPGMNPQVEAHTYAIKGERLEPVRTYGPACSERGWPYFETSCLRDTNSPTREARSVRMVGTDRVPAPADPGAIPHNDNSQDRWPAPRAPRHRCG